MARRVEEYLTLQYLDRGREWPAVDCWGLVRLFVGEQGGLWLPSYGEVAATDLDRIAGEIGASRASGIWREIVPGEERRCDVVLINDLTGKGTLAPLHVGVVTSPGYVLHIKEKPGAMHVPFRDGVGLRGHPSVARLIAGIFRHEALQ